MYPAIANPLILHSKEKTGWILLGTLTSVPSECFWSPLLNEFSDNLTPLSIFTLNIKQFL